MDKINDFLKELSELTNKYGLYINACGCCNSPWIVDCETNDIIRESLDFNKQTGKYEAYEV